MLIGWRRHTIICNRLSQVICETTQNMPNKNVWHTLRIDFRHRNKVETVQPPFKWYFIYNTQPFSIKFNSGHSVTARNISRDSCWPLLAAVSVFVSFQTVRIPHGFVWLLIIITRTHTPTQPPAENSYSWRFSSAEKFWRPCWCALADMRFIKSISSYF